jgi:hypothetical protein
LDELQEKIAEFEDYVQSTDVAAMQSKSLHFRCTPGLIVALQNSSIFMFTTVYV